MELFRVDAEQPGLCRRRTRLILGFWLRLQIWLWFRYWLRFRNRVGNREYLEFLVF